MPQGNVDIARRAFELFSRRDVDRLVELLAPDVEFHPVTAALVADGEPYRGHDGIRRYFVDAARLWKELRVTPREIREEGDVVVAVGRVYARGQGRVIDSPAGWVWRFREGRIVWGRVFADQREAREYAASRV